MSAPYQAFRAKDRYFVIRQLGFPATLHGTPQQIRLPPPLLGQHTDEILSDAGMHKNSIAALRERGAFG